MPTALASKRAWALAAFGLVLLGALLRLPILSTPREVVFDEVHFGRFAYAYCCTGERFFDLHPPHAKLLIAGALKLAGGAPPFDYTPIGKPYPSDYPVFAFRVVAALAGILLPVAVLALLAAFGVPILPAGLAGFALAMDGGWWVHTRFALLDGVQVTATFAALALLAWALRFAQRWSWVCAAAAGVAAGFAVGTKFSGLALLVPMVLLLMLRGNSLRQRLSVGAVVLVVAGVIYIGGWYLHFRLVPRPPDGYDWYVPTGRLLEDIMALHRVMFRANYQLSSGHPDASVPWRWPFMGRAVFYWMGPERVIYLVGNPVVWLGAPLVVLVAGLRGIMKSARARIWTAMRVRSIWDGVVAHAPQLVLAAGFVSSWLPFVLVKRPLFLYHWLVPLVWLVALAASTQLFSRTVEQRVWRLHMRWTLPVLVVIGFVIVLPFTSGWPLVPELRAALVARLVIFRY